MQAGRPIDPRIPVRDRLSMRLALLFVGTFLGVLILLMAWTMFATIAERRQAAANLEVRTPVIIIDPKIQTDLAKALAFDALPVSVEVLNPFVDRAGLSGNLVTANSATLTQASASPASPSKTSAVVAGQVASRATTASNNSAAANIEPYSVRTSYDDWLYRQKRGEFVGPESEILAVEDLVPVGYASGGDRPAEVILFSLALCRTFSFPAGTRFWNGSLSGFDQSEVVFAFQDGLRRKSYSSGETCQ